MKNELKFTRKTKNTVHQKHISAPKNNKQVCMILDNLFFYISNLSFVLYLYNFKKVKKTDNNYGKLIIIIYITFINSDGTYIHIAMEQIIIKIKLNVSS